MKNLITLVIAGIISFSCSAQNKWSYTYTSLVQDSVVYSPASTNAIDLTFSITNLGTKEWLKGDSVNMYLYVSEKKNGPRKAYFTVNTLPKNLKKDESATFTYSFKPEGCELYHIQEVSLHYYTNELRQDVKLSQDSVVFIGEPKNLKVFCSSIVSTPKAKKVVKENDFTIYPNPASKLIEFKGLADDKSYVLDIYNSTGVLVKTLYLKEKQYSLDIADLKIGTYIIKASSESNILQSSFIKVK